MFGPLIKYWIWDNMIAYHKWETFVNPLKILVLKVFWAKQVHK